VKAYFRDIRIETGTDYECHSCLLKETPVALQLAITSQSEFSQLTPGLVVLQT
jgi:hypothetical protein